MGRIPSTLRTLTLAATLAATGCCLETISGATTGGTSSAGPSGSSSSGSGIGSTTGRPAGTSNTSGTTTGSATSTGTGSTTGPPAGTSSTSGTTTGAASCTIAGLTYPARATNPTDPAQCCNPAINASSWLPLFTQTSSFPIESSTISGPNDGAAGDLNGDGIADVVLTAYAGSLGTSQAWVYLSVDGGFSGPDIYPSTQPGEVWPGGITLGDLNNDGLLDLIVSTQDSVDVFLNLGHGQFGGELFTSTPASCGGAYVRIADVNLDGWQDVLALTQYCGLELFLNQGQGDGVLADPQILASTQVQSDLAIGDFNGDGYPDVAFADPSGSLVWLPGSAGGFAAQPLTLPGSGLNGFASFPWYSGDLLAVAAGSTLEVFPATDGGPGEMASFTLDTSQGDVVAGAVNGGNLPVLLVASGWNAGTTIDVLADRGYRELSQPASFQVSPGQPIHSIELGDLNGDGALDLVVFRAAGSWEAWINTCGPGAAATIAAAAKN